MNSTGRDALSAGELDELAEFLGNSARSEAITLEGMDGLFCALAASPRMVPPHEYLPIIWGGGSSDDGAFSSIEEANSIMSLIMRHWNSIIDDFAKEKIHRPLVTDVGPGQVRGRAWARGFMRGVKLSGQGWGDLFGRDEVTDLFMIPVMAGEVDPEWPREAITAEKAEEFINSMAAGAAHAYRHFAEMRQSEAGSRHEAPFDHVDFDADGPCVRPAPKVGRNDPCPCGSGKKFKKCCGAAGVGVH